MLQLLSEQWRHAEVRRCACDVLRFIRHQVLKVSCLQAVVYFATDRDTDYVRTLGPDDVDLSRHEADGNGYALHFELCLRV